jgi:hypothetical protein
MMHTIRFGSFTTITCSSAITITTFAPNSHDSYMNNINWQIESPNTKLMQETYKTYKQKIRPNYSYTTYKATNKQAETNLSHTKQTITVH